MYTVVEFRMVLSSSPKGLDATYARILTALDDQRNLQHIRKTLPLLILSDKRTFLDEAAEMHAIELGSVPQVDLERRLIKIYMCCQYAPH